MKSWRLILGVVAVAALCACGDDATTSTNPTGSGAGGTGGAAAGGMGGTTSSSSGMGGMGGMFTGATVTYTGNISHAISMEPLANATVCVTEPNAGCAQTDANGNYTFPGVPANMRIRVRTELDTFFPVEGLIDTTDMDGIQDAVMLPTLIIEVVFGGNPPLFDSNRPAISVGVIDANGDGLPGYSAILTPSGNLSPGVGPFYLNNAGIEDNATTTTATGQAAFINLDIGDYDVAVVGPTDCTPAIQAPLNSQPAPLQNASLFAAFFVCE